jgi:hypothetical protein
MQITGIPLATATGTALIYALVCIATEVIHVDTGRPTHHTLSQHPLGNGSRGHPT